MFTSLHSRAAAAIVSGAVILGSISAVTPAIADEATETTTVSGFVTATSARGGAGEHDAPFLLRVPGQGYLNVDYSAIDLAKVAKAKSKFEIEVPAGVDLGDSSATKFDALLDASLEAPLSVVDVVAPSGAEARVNITPATTATHKVYAVAVTPSNSTNTAPDATQTPEAIATNVAASSSYWSSQSTGKVKFSLEGTSAWYKSATSCDVENDENATALFNEAFGVATSQLGFEEAYNTHLVLVFPSTVDCGGAVGLGTVGYTINDGGVLWTIGGATNYEKATLAHELGHNLSLGHASYLNCSTSAPNVFSSTCGEILPYGDVVDVMGYGSYTPDLGGGALSSAQAIRSGLWSSSAYAVTKPGKKSYTIKNISDNSGLRGLEVVGKSGTSFFVEFRNYTGEDAGYKGSLCVPDACVSNRAGVRVLTNDTPNYGTNDDPFFINGYAGDDSLLIGRTVSGAQVVDYGKGQSFKLDGVTIAVASVSTASAKVTVTTPKATGWYWDYYLDRTVGYEHAELTAGDVITAFQTTDWSQDSVSYQWLRSGKAISGATKQSYTLGASDIGKTVSLKITAKTKGRQSLVGVLYLYDAYGYPYGPVVAGVLDTGTVAIDTSATPLKAKLTSWLTPSVTYSYQWLRDGAAISKATASTYTPVSADSGKPISVKVTAKKSGYPTQSVTSAPVDVTITATGTPAIVGDARVGATLELNVPSYTAANPVTVTYQWYRSGVAIKGKTASSYTLTSSDLSKVITAKVTAKAPGYVSKTLATPATAKVAKGILGGTNSASIIVGDTLTASSGITETGATKKYQWYVGGKAVSKATKSTYTPKASDNTKEIKVTITVSKTGYTTVSASAVLPPL